MTGTTVSLLPAAGTTRPSAPSLGLLAGIEMRKSLSTRSGKAVGVVAMLVGPTGVFLSSLGGDGEPPAGEVLGFAGMITALVLLALGVLSTAGEWTHTSVQVTYLLVPQRLRVQAAKVLAMTVLGAGVAALAAGLTTAVLWAVPNPVDWAGFGGAAVVFVVAGAAMAVVGVGVGAALGNVPAALTGVYLTVLGVLPILHVLQPSIAQKLDPAMSIVLLAVEGVTTTRVLVLVGWVVVSVALGTVVTRRRSVQ